MYLICFKKKKLYFNLTLDLPKGLARRGVLESRRNRESIGLLQFGVGVGIVVACWRHISRHRQGLAGGSTVLHLAAHLDGSRVLLALFSEYKSSTA